jgi:hypothetical protein
MTAIAKAQELINKYSEHSYISLINNPITSYHKKQCALICVDEILESKPTSKVHTFKCDLQISKEYWQEVKQEIIKL